METVLVQYKDFFILLGNLLIALVFLLIGYAMGRNSIDKPVVAVKAAPKPDAVPFHDDFPSVYDEALLDDGGRVATV